MAENGQAIYARCLWSAAGQGGGSDGSVNEIKLAVVYTAKCLLRRKLGEKGSA